MTDKQTMGGAAKKRSDPRRARTRGRLITAATELVHTEGLSELTVSAITRRVGVNQSLFYYHFVSLDDCLAEAGREIVAQLAPLDRSLRTVQSWSRGTTHQTVRFYEDALDRWMAAGPLVELLIAHRLDGSAFGKAMQPQMDKLRDELTFELWEGMARFGVAATWINEVRLLADQLSANWYWAVEVLISGRNRDRSQLARTLAHTIEQLVTNTTQRLLGEDGLSVAERRLTPSEREALVQSGKVLRAQLEEEDDAALVASYGGEAAIVDFALKGFMLCYLPDSLRRSFSVLYRIQCPDSLVEAQLRYDTEGCRRQELCGNADITLSMSMRALMHLAASHDERNIEVEGDVRLAAQMTTWFYVPPVD